MPIKAFYYLRIFSIYFTFNIHFITQPLLPTLFRGAYPSGGTDAHEHVTQWRVYPMGRPIHTQYVQGVHLYCIKVQSSQVTQSVHFYINISPTLTSEAQVTLPHFKLMS